MFKATQHLTFLSILSLGTGLTYTHAQVTAGYDFEVIASDDTDGDRYWEDSVGTSGFDLYLDSSPAVTRTEVISDTKISHAYDFPGGSTGDQEGGSALVNSGGTSSTSFELASGDWSDNDVSIEMWFRPHELTPVSTNGQILFESGGGTGLGIFVDDNELVVSHDAGENQITYNLSTDPSGYLMDAATDEFIHMVVTHDTGSPYLTQLYINGNLVGTSNDDSDWTGSDGSAFGGRGGSNAGGRGSGQLDTESFNGEIAIIRVYSDELLSTADVTNNFEMVTSTLTLGYDFEVNAGVDTDADNDWEDTVGTSGFQLLLDNSPAITRSAITTDTLLTHAYDFPGGSTNNDSGATLVTNGFTETTSFKFAPGDWSTNDTTFEIWFRPDTLTPTPTNGQVVFEEGGGTGLGLFVDDNELVFSQDGGQAQITYDLSTDPSKFLINSAVTEFMQAVMTVEAASPYTAKLYLNGQLVGSNTEDDADWGGGDGTAFGTSGGVNVGGRGSGLSATESFDGEIALARIYNGQVLSAQDVADNFGVLTPPVARSLSPADDSTAVYPGTDFSATFFKDIILTNGGAITITNATLGFSEDITIPDARVTALGKTITISLATNLGYNTNYELYISPDAIIDADTNWFGGITNSTAWTFTTAAQDLTAPVITNTSPVDDSTDIAFSTILVVYFDDVIIEGSGDIVLTNLTDSLEIETVDISSSQVSISSNRLMITPSSPFDAGIEVAVRIDSGAVKNTSDVDFGGINDNTTWSFTILSDAIYTGPNTSNNDRWNTGSNWDVGIVPYGGINVSLNAANPYVTVWSDSTPTYTGNLTMADNTTIQIGWTTVYQNSWNALGTAGSTLITMGDGAYIKNRTDASPTIPEILMTGDVIISLGESTQKPASPTFSEEINGPHRFRLQSNASGPTVIMSASNSMSEFEIKAISGRGGNHGTVRATAAGSLGANEVTITPVSSGGAGLKLEVDIASAFSPTGTLNLAGQGPSGNGANVIQMDADNTIEFLTYDGYPYPTGRYGRVSSPSTVDYNYSWMSGDSKLTVTNAPADSTAPTVASITDNAGGGPIMTVHSVTYTVNFSEPVKASQITTAIFEDGGTSGASIDSVTATAFAWRWTVTATPSTSGTMILQIKSGTFIEDLFNNAMDTSSAIPDPTTITVNPVPSIWPQLDILSGSIFTSNFGKHPVTGDSWKAGDKYRLAFVSTETNLASSTDINTYNTFVQTVADGSTTYTNLGDVTWKAIASTAAVDARDNTATRPGVSPDDGPIYRMNGTTKIADSYSDLWDSSIDNEINRTEENVLAATHSSSYGNWVGTWTGTGSSGIENNPLGGGSSVRIGLARGGTTQHWINRANANGTTTYLPFYGMSEPLTIQGIQNTSASNLTTTLPTLNATLWSAYREFDVYVHYGETDGGTNFTLWSNSVYVAGFTNETEVNLTFGTNDLLASTTYYYTFRLTNATTNIWADPSATFTMPNTPYVNNSTGATAVSQTSATIRGLLTNGLTASAWFCWGDNDGGITDTSDWDNVVSMGEVLESIEFTTLITGLTTNQSYWYRCYVSNAFGDNWSYLPELFSGTGGSGVGPPPSAVGNPYFEWDAAKDVGGNSAWTSTTANAFTWTFDAGNQTPSDITDSRFDLLTKAYDFPGASDDFAGNWQSLGGGGDSATFEFVLDTDTRDGLIFEAGGTGDGISFYFTNGVLEGYIMESSLSKVSYTLTPADSNRFLHIVFVADNAGDTFDLYVDNDNKASVAWSLGDNWAGGNEIGLGAYGSSSMAPYNIDPGDFSGQMALFRYYRYKAFNADEVTTNFLALSSGSSDIVNTAPTFVTNSQATLNANLDAENTNYWVTVYWGSTDGGTTPGSWDNSAYVGGWTNIASTNLSYLATALGINNAYWYTFQATNTSTNIWASPSWGFYTPVDTGAAIGTLFRFK